MPRRAQVLATSSLLAVGLVVGGGYLVNAATSPSTTITACSHKKTGAVRIVAAKAKCAKNEKRVTWNVKGATGAQGLTGLAGPAGSTGATGAAGADGRDGAAGKDGEDGAPGLDGKDGVPGLDGKDGAPGKDGADGKDGAEGPAGPAGGSAEVDPNPNDLTYWMVIGSDPIMEIAGFTQKMTQSGTTQTGGIGGAGKATFGDIVATLPMNSPALNQMMQLAKGTHVPKARLDMCKPGERDLDPRNPDFGKCTLSLEVSDVLVTAVDVQQDPKQATVTVQLNFAKERISILPGTPESTTYEWNIAENVAGSSSGSTRATADGGTTYTTTLTGAGPLGVLSTRSWSQSSSQSGTTHMGGGGGAGKPAFADVVAETRTGHGTVELFKALAKGTHLKTVEIAGCESSACTSTLVLSEVIVTELVLGSPSLFDQVQFDYAKIKWDRNDAVSKKSFFWDLLANLG